MTQFEVAGQTYSAGKLTLKEQFHISRKLLSPSIWQEKKIDTVAIYGAIVALSDANAEFVINTCLRHVQRKSGEIFGPVGSLESPMYQDITPDTLYTIAAEVIRDSMANFFAVMLSKVEARADLKE